MFVNKRQYCVSKRWASDNWLQDKMPPAYFYKDGALDAFVSAAAPGTQSVRTECNGDFHLHYLICCMLTGLVPQKLLFYFPFQKVHNNKCPNIFDPVWLAPWCLLLLPLFFSSPWSDHQRDPGAGHVGEPVERGGHQCPHAWQLRRVPRCSAEPTGSYPSSSRFSESIEVQWLSVLPDCAETEEFGETNAALALDHSWVPPRGKGNTCSRT